MRFLTLASTLLTLFVWMLPGTVLHLSAQNTGILAGTVKDKITQEAIIGAAVKLEGADRGASTDVDGRFKIEGILPKSYNVTVSYIGYTPQTRYNVVVTTGNANFLNFEIEPDNKALGEVTISENKSVRIASVETPLSIQNLSAQEIKANPGGNFDISQVITTLPGVGGTAAGGAFRNDLVIRGGGPSENVYYLDGMEIPVINHFATQGAAGGPTGILNVSFIEDATLSTSAFNARYDNPLSAVLQLRQRDGNPDKFQGNFRLSGTEVALTGEGPLGKKTTFLASARRSYLQLLFKALDLPIRPDYWDFQYKITHKINAKTTFTMLGVGAIDDFYFAVPKEATAENVYIFSSNPRIKQWNYTQGFALKHLINNGFWNLTFSRNMFDNQLDKFRDNTDGQQRDESKRSLGIKSQEIENKLRFDVNKYAGDWKFSFGAGLQYVKYNNAAFTQLRPQILDSNGVVVLPAIEFRFNTAIDFFKFGLFGQVNRTFFNERLSLSGGIRADGNSFASDGANLLNTLSPRLSASLALAPKWKLNASIGRYYKIAPYTILGYRDERNALVNKDLPYIRADHYVAGLEYVPTSTLRITLEGFYKKYGNYPVSSFTGISLANLGGGYGIVGNEQVTGNGQGETYGMELFVQQKLWKNFFFVGSFTYFYSRFSGNDQKLVASSWDNRNLIALTLGKKFRRNWELGLKWRYQGGAPYTPFDEAASRRNYLTIGEGTLDYGRLNTERLGNFNQLDIRIDKKWNFRRTTLDVYIDVTNLLATANPSFPSYTFKRNADNTDFETTDGQPIKTDGSNAIPYLLPPSDASVLPTIGFIFEF
jgi:outer membrane receptor for ferrienterochelin and colicin